MDLFSAETGGLASSPPPAEAPAAASPTPADSPALPTVTLGGRTASQSAARGGAGPSRQGAGMSAATQPKSVLAEKCRKAGWGQPQYHRVPAPGGGWACEVAIDMGHRAPKGSTARRKGLLGLRTFAEPLDEDGRGWVELQVSLGALAFGQGWRSKAW